MHGFGISPAAGPPSVSAGRSVTVRLVEVGLVCRILTKPAWPCPETLCQAALATDGELNPQTLKRCVLSAASNDVTRVWTPNFQKENEARVPSFQLPSVPCLIGVPRQCFPRAPCPFAISASTRG